jgi:Flp pilus assembly protein TadG
VNLRRSARGEEGAAAVEFALISGVLVMLVFGMLEFGLAFWQVQNLRSATREAGRVAAVRGQPNDIQTRLVQASNGSLPPGYSGYTVQVDGVTGLCTVASSGRSVRVAIINGALPINVRSAFQIQVPFLPSFTVNPDLSGTFRCE